MPRYTSEEFTGAIESTVVTLLTDGWQNAVISFDEGSASAGTVAITIKPPDMTAAKTYGANGTYTVNTDDGRQIALLHCDIGTLILTPDSVNAAMTYRVCCYNG